MRHLKHLSSLLIAATLGGTVAHAEVAQPAKPIPAKGMIDDDYPAEALRLRQQGDVEVQFEISDKGRVENCSVLKSSGSQSLDDTTCRIVTRMARYKPARDEKGRRIRSSGTKLIKWRLPR